MTDRTENSGQIRGRVLVTGARGTTGRRLVVGLRGRADVVEASRSGDAGPGSVRFDWHAPDTWDGALDGVTAAYLVPPTDSGVPAPPMLRFLERARRRGLRRVVLLGAAAVPPGLPGVGEVHAALPDLMPEWAVVRPSWFMQNFVGDHHQAVSLRDRATVRTATGDGRVPFVDADDIAAVAVVALTAAESLDRDVVVTGPEALSYDDVADTLTTASGRPVRHERCTAQQMRDEVFADLPRELAALLADLDVQIREGRWATVTDEVERLTGRPASTFADFAVRNASAWSRPAVPTP